jgi:hypothetical protein
MSLKWLFSFEKIQADVCPIAMIRRNGCTRFDDEPASFQIGRGYDFVLKLSGTTGAHRSASRQPMMPKEILAGLAKKDQEGHCIAAAEPVVADDDRAGGDREVSRQGLIGTPSDPGSCRLCPDQRKRCRQGE